MAVHDVAVSIALLGNPAAENRRVIGFANDDPGVGTLLLEDPRNPFQRAARAKSRHPVIERAALER